jgi:hypothetical protein
MKREMDLIRSMVLAVEDAPHGFAVDDLVIDGYTREQIDYHAYLLIQGGLVRGEEISCFGDASPVGRISSLTWEGHEFAAAARDESRWKEATRIAKEKSGTVTVGVITQFLAALMKAPLGL